MPLRRDHVVAGQAEPVGQAQPALDAAVAGALAVVVDDALAPDAAQLGVVIRAIRLASFTGIEAW